MHSGCAASRRKARAVACMLVRDDAELTGAQFFFLLSFFPARWHGNALARDDAELRGTQFPCFAMSFNSARLRSTCIRQHTSAYVSMRQHASS